MADITIDRSHSLGLDDGRAAVERVANKLEEELGVDYEWRGNTLRFDGEGADGHIEVQEESVRLEIDLPLFLRPMQGRVREEAEAYLDRHF